MWSYLYYHRRFYAAALIFVLAMSVYLWTLAPTISPGDSGELVTAAYTLGIPHPSGYPLYVLLGKLFTFLPLGTIAWRVNLLSAIFAALCGVVLFLVIEKVTKKTVIALGATLTLLFTALFWSQAIIAKFYPLNAFFVALLIWLALWWQKDQAPHKLMWFAFFYGLALTNHTMMVLFLPAFVCFFVLHDRELMIRWGLLAKLVLCFAAGLLVYLYIPLRAWQHADFNWGPITTWTDVLSHIMRKQYDDFSPLTSVYSKIGILISFFFLLYQQFLLPTVLLALLGVVLLWKRELALGFLTVGIFLGNSVGIIFLRKYGWQIGIETTYDVYYLPALMMVVIWFAYVISYFDDIVHKFFVSSHVLRQLVSGLIGTIVVVLPITFIVANYRFVDMSGYWFNYDYAKNLLMSLEPNSVYYFAYDGSLQGDTELFSLVYLKLVEHVRPDVSVVSEQNLFYKDYYLRLPLSYFKLTFEDRRRQLFHLLAQIKNRPLYANFALTEENNDQKFWSISNMYAYRIYPSIDEALKAKFSGYMPSIRNVYDITADDQQNAGLASHYFYSMAAFYLTHTSVHLSEQSLIKAFTLDTAPFNHEYRRFLDYRTDWLRQTKKSS